MKLYSTKEFAERAGVSIRTLKRWRKDGKLIPAKTIKGDKFYSEEQLVGVTKYFKVTKFDTSKVTNWVTNWVTNGVTNYEIVPHDSVKSDKKVVTHDEVVTPNFSQGDNFSSKDLQSGENDNLTASSIMVNLSPPGEDMRMKENRIDMAKKFLDKLFGKITEKKFSYIWILKQNDKKSISFDVSDEKIRAEMAKRAIEMNDSGYNVFVGVNLTENFIGEYERAKEADIKVQTAIIADIDVANGLWHVGDKYPADFNTAKSFLPFAPSILVDSGAGLHSYIQLKNPLPLSTDEEREKAVSRNKNYLEIIRTNAGIYSGAVDSVHDLPRVLRLPGTYNLKHGKENAPLCKVVEFGDDYESDKLRELIKAPTHAKKSPVQTSSTNFKNSNAVVGDKPSVQVRALAMLKFIPTQKLTYDEWLHIGIALKTNGNDCADWSDWSSQDDRFKIGECEKKWEGFDRTDLTIRTIYRIAERYGYNEKDFQREWYRDNPEYDRKNYSRRSDESTADKNFSADAQSDSLEKELQEINKKLADFEQEKTANIEKLKSVEIPAENVRDFAFADEIVTAAAWCENFARKVLSEFKKRITDKHKGESFIADWNKDVKDKAAEITARHNELSAQKILIQIKINNSKYLAKNPELSDLIIPDVYEVNDSGIKKFCGDKLIDVAFNPAYIQAKRINYEDDTNKFILAYKSENGKWKKISPTNSSTVFNARKLVELADFGLPVTSVNANEFVKYLDNFRAVNEKNLPLSYDMPRVGLYNLHGFDYFVDPRKENFISDNGKKIEIFVKPSPFIQSLKTVGSLDEWRKAYEVAKKAPIARLIVAASVAAPLLKIVGERNFVLYTHGHTRGGKSTCLLLGASTVGSTDMVISFDGTKNGLLGRVIETNDYPFFVDEKQSADKNLKTQFTDFIYTVANGKERVRAKRDGSIKSVREWQNIMLCNGETQLLDETATGGALTRLLQIQTPKTILPPTECENIRRIIKNNYGHAFLRVVDKFFEYGFEELRELYQDTVSTFTAAFPELLNDYCRYIAIMTLADAFLNIAFDVEVDTAFSDAKDNARIIFDFVPTIEDISDSDREFNFVLDFIAQNQKYFLGATPAHIEQLPFVYGNFDKDFVYITVSALQKACKDGGFDYSKLVADMTTAGKFNPKSDSKSIQHKIGKTNCRCFKIPTEFVS